MNRRQHREGVYSTKASKDVSWYQREPEMSLRMLDAAGLAPSSRVIDVGGGDSRLVDALLSRGLTEVTVLDISSAALERARARLGAAGERVGWLCQDVTDMSAPLPAVDLWHDRAVFHFLTDPADRARYVSRLEGSVVHGGGVVMATFALDGPERCSGLPVARYSPESLAAELGPPFALVESAREEHRTPGGSTQAFSGAGSRGGDWACTTRRARARL